MQALQQALQQGMQAAQQAMQQGIQAAQQSDASKLASNLGLPSADSMAGLADSALKDAVKGAGGGGGGGGGRVPGSPLSRDAQASAKLFPRAAVSANLSDTLDGVARAGVSSSSGGMGSPGGMGPAAGAGQGQQNKERKRVDYLDSDEWLEEALGGAPVVAKPVVEK
jgi:hypothetical protein